MPEINSSQNSSTSTDSIYQDELYQQLVDEGVLQGPPSAKSLDTLALPDFDKTLPSGYLKVGDQIIFQEVPTSASAPDLVPPGNLFPQLAVANSVSVTTNASSIVEATGTATTTTDNTTDETSSTDAGTPLKTSDDAPSTGTVNTDDLQQANIFFNATSLTALTIALVLVALAMQKQKLTDKQEELELNGITYKMAVESAQLTIQLGHLEQWEHIWKGVAIVAAGVATGMAARYLPMAAQAGGANQIMFWEMTKSLANAASEFVSAAYAVPKATLQALKQVKDQVIQLLMSAKESSAALAKEDQDNFDRLIQSIDDMIQKLKRAYEFPT